MSPAAQSRACAVAFGLLFLVTEAIGSHLTGGYSLFQIVWMRYAVHLLLVFAIWGRRDPLAVVRTRRPGLHLVRSLLMLAMPGSWILAAGHGVNPLVLLAGLGFVPMLVIAAARMVLGEQPSAHSLAAGALMAAGAALILLHRVPADPRLLALALVPALSFALYIPMTALVSAEPLKVNLFHTALGVFLCLSLLQPGIWVEPSLHDLPFIVGIAASGLLVFVAIDRMVHLAPLWVSAPFTGVQVVIAVLAAITAAAPLRTHAGVASLLLMGAALVLPLLAPRPAGVSPA